MLESVHERESVMGKTYIRQPAGAAPGAGSRAKRWRGTAAKLGCCILAAGLVFGGTFGVGAFAQSSASRPTGGSVQPAVAWGGVDATEPTISVEPAMLGCGMGAAAGTLFVAFYPLSKWAKDAGALPGMGAVLFRGLLGCSYGLTGGLAYSVGNSTLDFLDRTFSDVF